MSSFYITGKWSMGHDGYFERQYFWTLYLSNWITIQKKTTHNSPESTGFKGGTLSDTYMENCPTVL